MRATRKSESAGAAGASGAGHDGGSDSASDSGKEAAHKPAGAGARSRRPNIAFIAPVVASSLHTEYVGDIASGIEQVARSRGFTIFTINSANDPDNELDILNRLTKDDVGGIALWPADGSKAQALVRTLTETGYPIVLVDRYLVGSNACAVASDNFGGAFAATRYLLSLGHRRIGFVATSNLSTTSVADRLRGYRHALKLAGIPYDPSLVFDSYPWYVQVAELPFLLTGGSDSDIDGCISYLKEVRPTAVITLNERVAVTFLRLCRELEEVHQCNLIKEKVASGQWKPTWGMWVEADCNVTSGESLVRQLLFGTRFFRQEFGRECKVLWLPDVFGYSWALPQIIKKSGLEYFMTTKISWNQYNRPEYDTFMWRGMDGTEVLTHFITTPELRISHQGCTGVQPDGAGRGACGVQRQQTQIPHQTL
ncbi:MAG TPA: substrate-binding domain-containing protein [Firmicutes bacterium]|nr:substrate-binding domain-containing protein [Bacillota bacterium]